MKNIDEIDYQFIRDNCPDGMVPVLIIKTASTRQNAELHEKVKHLYKVVARSLKNDLIRHLARKKIVEPDYNKDELVYVYYMSPEERAAFNAEKHRLVYFNYSYPQPESTVCCSFNDKNRPVNAFTIPIAKIKTDKDVSAVADELRQYLAKEVNLYVNHAGNNGYEISFSARNSSSCSIPHLKKSHLLLQLALLETFDNSELTLCDMCGNDYAQDKQREIVETLFSACTTPKKLFSLQKYLTNRKPQMPQLTQSTCCDSTPVPSETPTQTAPQTTSAETTI